jgi:hypothetical protein
MPARPLPDKFQVAFSFAGEQRDRVRSIAELVEKELGSGTVFLDEWFEAYLAGDDADLKLQDIYTQRCSLAVVCVSERYGGKPWTLAEHAAIRARVMQARAAKDERDRLAILPIRVGEGEVEGILFTTIVPDVRSRSAPQAAELVIERLRLIVPDLNAGLGSSPALFSWPETSVPLPVWPMANHTEARAAFERLLTRNPPWRCLPLRGSSETGKSHITRQMLANAVQMPDLACGRFDFKGTTDVDNEVRALVQYLEVPLPPDSPRLNERLSHILDALKQRARPALLIFDTYNHAAGEAQDWVEKQLLLRVMRDSWLRVVIAGQSVPKAAGATWESIARVPLQLMPPAPEEWFAFGRQHKPNLTLDFVRQAYDFCKGKPSLLAELLGPGT